MNIIKCTSTINTTICNRTPKYIVIHYTAGTTSKSGTAKNVAKYFAKTTTKASADFIVDDANIVQYNPDLTKRYCWSVGGNKYNSMSTSEGGKYYGIVKNSNSISIEMCSSKTNKNSLKATDTDWYITDAVIDHTIELTRYLMDLYNIPIENVVMHHSINGKVCPNPFCVNEKALSKWREFKSRLSATNTIAQASTSTTKPVTSSTPFLVKLLDNLNIRATPNGKIVVPDTDEKNGARKGRVYTIVEVSGNWGLLKTYAKKRNGWISISDKYVKRV